MASYGDRSTFRYPLAVVGLAAVFLGCEKRPEIAHYQVPKEAVARDPSAADETAGNSEATDRMLAAIVPHDGQAWFFKLSGPEAAVSKVAEDFESFVKTVSFPEKSGGKPDWKLPEGWEQKSGGADLRFATITIPADGKPMDLTVSMPLPWKAGDKKELLDNVNRWRGQMQLPPVGAKDVSNDTHTLNLADAKTDAIVVDLKGRLKAGGMTPPFAGKAAGELPAGHPPVAKSSDEKKPAPSPIYHREIAIAVVTSSNFRGCEPSRFTAHVRCAQGLATRQAAGVRHRRFQGNAGCWASRYFDQPDGWPGGWHVGECQSLARTGKVASDRRGRTGRHGASVQSRRTGCANGATGWTRRNRRAKSNRSRNRAAGGGHLVHQNDGSRRCGATRAKQFRKVPRLSEIPRRAVIHISPRRHGEKSMEDVGFWM